MGRPCDFLFPDTRIFASNELKQNIMPASIVTSDDLEKMKEELLYDIKEILIKHERITIDRWIKSGKVMDKLNISPGTLQNFRINETIPFTKLGGIIYYDEAKINEIMVLNETISKKLNP